MLSNKQIICPNNLLDASIKKKGATAAIVNAGKPLPMQSVMDAVKEDLIKPIFIGDKDQIQKCANEIQFDILHRYRHKRSIYERVNNFGKQLN